MLDSEFVECRQTADITGTYEKGVLQGIIIQEGRAARGGRAEVFAPGSCIWRPRGVELRNVHSSSPKSRILGHVLPTRDADGNIRFEEPLTPTLRTFAERANGLSLEFVPLTEHRTAAGVREIEQALVVAVAFTKRPEYWQAKAEMRASRRERRW